MADDEPVTGGGTEVRCLHDGGNWRSAHGNGPRLPQDAPGETSRRTLRG